MVSKPQSASNSAPKPESNTAVKIAFFDSHQYDLKAFETANQNYGFTFTFLPTRLNEKTMQLAAGHDVVCSFVNDSLNSEVLDHLKESGIQFIALRSAGFNHVDLQHAQKIGLKVVRVPEYSPYAVAEHAVALILTLNRKIHRSFARVREMNFSLEGLVGFDLNGKTVGVLGTGKIGAVFCRIMRGFGCQVLAYDLQPDSELVGLGVQYVDIDTLYLKSDILSLHLPLTPQTKHLLNDSVFDKLKPGAVIINTSRGALIDTKALIMALKSRKLGGAGLDVYEEEEGVFFEDRSALGIDDDQLARLLTFPNVLITSHQGFLTKEALSNISETTLQSISDFMQGRPLRNEISPPRPLW